MNLSGGAVDYLVVFAAGIVLSFTPCVYPLIPVSIGVIGINAQGSKARGFFLGLVYVCGVAVTYSALGLLASFTGQIFGGISSSPLIHIIVGSLVIIFGIFMMDIFAVPLPQLVKVPTIRKRGTLSVLLMGLVSGLIVSPCITPALGAILVYLGARKNLIYGTTLLFTFAFGMGLTLILAGTFSSFLLNLPKSGRWMLYIKKAYALILTGVGIYFILNGIRSM